MKSEKIIDALGKIDDKLVMEVVPGMPVRKKRQWATVVAAAAVIGVCIFGVEKLGLISISEEYPSVHTTISKESQGVDWEYVKQKLMTAPAPKEIGEETKQKFFDYFRENKDDSFMLLLSFDWEFEMSDSYQMTMCPTLNCIGKTADGIQTTTFVYINGEVLYTGKTVKNDESIASAIEAAFPDVNITDIVHLQDRKGVLQQYSYELLSSDGLNVGGKSVLSEELYMEELNLLSQNIYTTSGTLVFVDHQAIPSYFVEDKTMNVLLTCSGRVKNSFAVWAVPNTQIAENYQSFLEKVMVYLYEKRAEYYEKQYTLQGVVVEVDYENHVLKLDGQIDGTSSFKGPLEVYFSDSEINSLDACRLVAYAGEDCGFPRAENTFYSVGYAAEQRLPRTAEGCDLSIAQIRDYLRIMQNREPMHGSSCSVEIGDLAICLQLPEEWSGKYGIEQTADSVSFYHQESKNAQADGVLFTIQIVTEDHTLDDSFKRLLFEGEDYKIGFFRPTGMQSTIETMKEFEDMKEDVEAIVDSVVLVE